MSKSRVIIGVCCILITYPLNHIDYLIPEFTTLNIFGKSFEIVEGFTSTDIIWTLVQKVNLIILCTAIVILFPLNRNDYKTFKALVPLSLFLIIGLNLFLVAGDMHSYIMGFNRILYFLTFLFLSLIIISIFLLGKHIAKRRRTKISDLRIEIDKLKTDINNRLDSLQDTNLDITNKIEALESLPLFIKETDNMETWSKLAHRRAMMIYGQLDKQLKDLEEAKTIAV
ncbi:hypothetical protein ACFO3O_22000 [Dokdonia ponticola]|uniref:Uncharacterized protein n=1 Tax=Dokdonia ponticola TaxID=2041041 RepID=A0ABV9I325_9FLAO